MLEPYLLCDNLPGTIDDTEVQLSKSRGGQLTAGNLKSLWTSEVKKLPVPMLLARRSAVMGERREAEAKKEEKQEEAVPEVKTASRPPVVTVRVALGTSHVGTTVAPATSRTAGVTRTITRPIAPVTAGVNVAGRQVAAEKRGSDGTAVVPRRRR